MSRPLAQIDIEREIMAITDALENETYRYAECSRSAAIAEADYKLKIATAIVHLAADIGRKMTANERAARAELSCGEELRAYRLADAVRSSSKEALLSLRARLDALRTLSANVRQQT